jgi:hypothetical protein
VTLTARIALPFGLMAEVLTSDEDRPPPTPAPVHAPYEHHERCGCAKCVTAAQALAREDQGRHV